MKTSVRAKKELSAQQRNELLATLKTRFEKYLNRHKGLEWAKVQARLEANPGKLWSLNEMERTGGEPDVVGQDKKSGEFIFFDCSEQTPSGRVSLCYDREALDSRKEHKPRSSISSYRNWVSSTRNGQAGSRRRRRSENSAARFTVIAVTAACSSVTTAQSLTTAAVAFAVG